LEIPLPSFLQQVAENPPFAQPQTADPSVLFEDISPNRGVSSGKADCLGGMRRNTSSGTGLKICPVSEPTLYREHTVHK